LRNLLAEIGRKSTSANRESQLIPPIENPN
jgi:hypothetical protein